MNDLGAKYTTIPKLTDFGKEFYTRMGGMVDVNQKFDVSDEKIMNALYETCPAIAEGAEIYGKIAQGEITLEELSNKERERELYNLFINVKNLDTRNEKGEPLNQLRHTLPLIEEYYDKHEKI